MNRFCLLLAFLLTQTLIASTGQVPEKKAKNELPDSITEHIDSIVYAKMKIKVDSLFLTRRVVTIPRDTIYSADALPVVKYWQYTIYGSDTLYIRSFTKPL